MNRLIIPYKGEEVWVDDHEALLFHSSDEEKERLLQRTRKERAEAQAARARYRPQPKEPETRTITYVRYETNDYGHEVKTYYTREESV